MHPLTSLIFRCATSVALLATATACAPGLRPLPLPERAAPPAAEPAGKTAEQPAATWLTDADYLKSRQLMVPVHGVDPANVTDSFNDPRDGGARTHQAVDILAPRGTPVIAATDGVVLRMRSNTLGGITIYAVDSDRRFVYYYAHLERYEDGLAEGQSVVQGQVLGYVGTSGNAPEHIPHLHFQVMKMRADGRWWDGEPVDPRPFLFQAGIASGTDVEAARRASR
jgi:peptidoglycan LD-endopeptidase LytH